MLKRFLCVGAFFSILCPTLYAVEIPKNLSESDRKEVMRILGAATSTKALSNPYPLGGFSGLEVGMAVEIVNTEDLSRLGDKTSPDPEFRYPRLTLGKGLFYDVDFFLHFIPYSENSDLSEFGGMVRWSFYEAKFLPVNLSLQIHGSHLNFSDSFNNQTVGADIMCGINTNNFALYFGAGQVEAKGEFMVGGTGTDGVVDPSDPDVNTTTNTVRESITQTHSFVGFSLQFSDLFIAAQIDRYHDIVYSAKVGIRL